MPMLAISLVGLVVGLMLAITGAGGSVLAMPLLVLVIGLPFVEAVGLSLLVVSMSACVGVVLNWKQGNIVWPASLILIVVAGSFTPLGYWLHQQVPTTIISVLFLALIIVVLWSVYRQPQSAKVSVKGVFQRYTLLVFSAPWIGICSGFFGVGGGFLMVPLLTSVLGLRVQQALASSLLVIAITSFIGFALHLFDNYLINMHNVSSVTGGAMLGMYCGRYVSIYLSDQLFKHIFSGAVLILATTMVFLH